MKQIGRLRQCPPPALRFWPVTGAEHEEKTATRWCRFHCDRFACIVFITGGMITPFDESQAVAASSANLAKEIERSLIPSTVGFPLFAGGVILFVVGSWRYRKGRQITV